LIALDDIKGDCEILVRRRRRAVVRARVGSFRRLFVLPSFTCDRQRVEVGRV
jgi:hypothetical protein